MPATIPRDEEKVKRAKKLYVPGVFGHKRIARELGVSASSVRRWLNPERAERDRLLSRAAKKRRIGTCERCGGPTRYNGKTVNGPSPVCDVCAHEPWTHCARGHELTGDNDLRAQDNGWTCRTCRNDYMREYQRQRYASDPAVRERKRLDNAYQYAKRKARSEGAE